MISVGFDPASGNLVIVGRNVFPARSLKVTDLGGGTVRIWTLAQRVEFEGSWTNLARLDGTQFDDSVGALSYLQVEFNKGGAERLPIELPVVNSGSMDVTVDGQVQALLVNGLMASQNEFSVIGINLHISSGLLLMPGDLLTIFLV
jgi:hypothetical protein